jgi:hypothetical protein
MNGEISYQMGKRSYEVIVEVLSHRDRKGNVLKRADKDAVITYLNENYGLRGIVTELNVQ